MRAPSARGRRALLLAAAAALGLRAAYLIAADPGARYAPDSLDYVRAAMNIARYGEFSLSPAPPLVPDTVRTPGYPLLLAALSGPRRMRSEAVVWVQALLGALSAGLVAWAALLLWKDERAALWAGLFLAADAASVFHGGLVLTETLFSACMAGLLFLLAAAWSEGGRRAGWWAGAGLLCGAAPLVRPAGLYLFLFVSAAAALALSRARRPVKRPLSAFLAAALLLPALWTMRNGLRTGAWTFCSIQGMNIFGMRSAAVEMELTGLAYGDALSRITARLEAEHPGPASGPEEEARRQGRWAVRFLLSHPLAAAKVMAKDAVKMLGGHSLEIPAWSLLRDPAFDPARDSPLPPRRGFLSGTRVLLARHPGLLGPLLLYWGFLLAAYALAARGLARAWAGRQRGEALLAAAPVLYFLLVSAGALAYYRLRLPLMPAVFLLAGRGLIR